MIIDSPTRTIYTSSLFSEKYSDTFDSLTQQCFMHELHVMEITTGRNEWCRDFMPVLIISDKQCHLFRSKGSTNFRMKKVVFPGESEFKIKEQIGG